MNSDEPKEVADQGRTGPMSGAQQWADAATLAALMENGLSATDRERALAKLATEPELSAAFVDAAIALQMLEAESAPIAMPSALRMAPTGRTRTFWVTFAAAAAALAVAVGLYAMRSLRRPELGTPLEIIAMAGPVTSSVPEYQWRSVRGLSRIENSRAGQGVRIGEMIFELRSQLAANDSAAATQALAIATRLDAIPAGSAVGAEFRRVAAATSAAEALKIFGAAVNSADLYFPERELRVGVWLGAARTAAIRQDSAFFNRAETAAAINLIERNCQRVGCSSAAFAKLVEAMADRSVKDWNFTRSAIEQLIALLAH